MLDDGPEALHVRDDDGHTIMHWAAQSGNVEIVKWLIDNKVSLTAGAGHPARTTLFIGHQQLLSFKTQGAK